MSYDKGQGGQAGVVLDLPVGAAENISQSESVVLNIGNGYAEQGGPDSAYREWAGIATEFKDNSAGAAGALNIEVNGGLQEVTNVTVIGSGASGVLVAADMGKTVYNYGANSYSVDASYGGVPCGKLTEIISAGTSANGKGSFRTMGYGFAPAYDTGNWFIIEENWDTEIVSGDRWTILAPDSGTAVVLDEVGGTLQMKPSDGTVVANDEIAVHTTNEYFLCAAGRPGFWEYEIEVTEAGTDEAGVFIGLTDTATMIVDTTLAPIASFDGFGFYKPHSSLFFYTIVSNAGTQNRTQIASQTAWTSGTKYTVGFEWIAAPGATTGTLKFYLNKALYDSKTITISGMDEMKMLLAIKNEANTNNNTLECRNVYGRQYRL